MDGSNLYFYFWEQNADVVSKHVSSLVIDAFDDLASL